jgi:hypothetical protein
VNRIPPTFAFVIAAAAAASPATAQEPPAAVQGTVVARETRLPIAGAIVDLTDIGGAITDDAGRFRFDRVPAGRYELTVTMLGYETQVLDLPVIADTTLVVEMDVLPVALDPIDVRTFSLRGRVLDAATGHGIPGALVRADDREDDANVIGSFRIRRLPASTPIVVGVEAFGYLPHTIQLVALEDTTIRFELEVDPIGQRMIDAQVERIVKRSDAVPHARSAITRHELVRRSPWSAYDILKTRLGPRFNRIACLFIDDMQRRNGTEELYSYLPEELERIEIIDNGVMVRLYTRRQVQELVRGRVTLRPIMLIETPGGYICQ